LERFALGAFNKLGRMTCQ